MIPIQREESKRGRLDIAIKAMNKHLCDVIQNQTGVDLWGNGWHEMTEAFIEHWGIPREPINVPMTVARYLELLPKERKRRAG